MCSKSATSASPASASPVSASPRRAVIQPLVGIGDMVWFEPLFRQIGREGAFHLVAKPSSQAGFLFQDAPWLASVVDLERNIRGQRGRHDGMVGFWRMVAMLRRLRVHEVLVLHGSWRYGLAARCAGVSAGVLTCGKGSTHQKIAGMMRTLGGALTPPRLSANPHLCTAMRERYGTQPRPWLMVGVGASEAARRCPEALMIACLHSFMKRHGGTVFLTGSTDEEPLGARVMAGLGGRGQSVFGRAMTEVMALGACVDAYFGNDTSLLNVVAALGRPAVGLFGGSAPLTHDPNIVAVEADGMAAISQEVVMATLDDALAMA